VAGDLATGTVIAGYRIERTLGQGGMGVVYEATQLSLNRTVALKFLAAQFGADADFRERFRREGVIQAGIDHPHIVPVYEAGDVDGGLFIAMRLVRGSNLKELIRAGELGAARGLAILAPVADALAVAHDAGLIHRDIKPQNILVGPGDHGYLADFGLTKGPELASLTRTGQFLGSIDYVAPETVNGRPATALSDTYALAAVLYECLTDEVPYSRPSEAAVLFAHVADPPPRVSALRPELPPALDDVIARGMAKRPEERHASPRALLEDAERAFARSGAAAGRGRRVRRSVPAPRPAHENGAIRREATTVPLHETPERPRARRAVLAGGAALAVGAAALGIAAGGSGAPAAGTPATRSSVAAGGIVLEYTSAWRRVEADAKAIPGMVLRDPIALAPVRGPAGARLLAGHVDAASPSLLTAAFRKRLPEVPPRDDAVRLGETAAYRYADLRPRDWDRRVDLYAAPTTAGVATLACVVPRDARGSLAGACADVARTLTLSGERAYPLGADRGFAERLDRAVRTLNSRMVALRKRLRAAEGAGGQGRAAAAIAGAYRRAAGAVAAPRVSPAVAAGRQAIRSALARAATDYERLADAARSRSGRGFSRARRAVERDEADVRRALATLDEQDYDVG
jgi:Protein kinase domain